MRMYVRMIRMTAKDQFCPRITVKTIAMRTQNPKTIRCTPILTFPSAPFLNLSENIGNSLTSKPERMTDITGMLHLTPAQTAIVLSGHLVT